MRYLFGLLCLCALVVAPQVARAQAAVTAFRACFFKGTERRLDLRPSA